MPQLDPTKALLSHKASGGSPDLEGGFQERLPFVAKAVIEGGLVSLFLDGCPEGARPQSSLILGLQGGTSGGLGFFF